MSISEIIRSLERQISSTMQQEQEQKLLQEIEYLSDHDTAEKAAELFKPERNTYTTEEYLIKLARLKNWLAAGVVPEKAIMFTERNTTISTALF